MSGPKIGLVLIITIILNFNFALCNNKDVIVKLNNGKVKGETLLNWDNKQYYSFKAIPYAKPPLKELRFKAPVPAEPWQDILDATKPSPMCPQFDYEELVGQEDCLYLNVYTKSLDENAELPVMVYIHGGGYFVGSGSSSVYGPEFLLTEEIVLVTFDYRLGFLGALSFSDQTQGVPGNAHLKDQVMALKWIQENIGKFGGNKDLVTVFGESVGGASVHMHMLSPMSKGLVHRVIAESGCAVNAWNRGILGTGDKIAKDLGIDGNTEEIIKKLQEMPMEEFVRNTQEPGELSVVVHAYNSFSPVLETQTNEPAFLPKLPIDLIPEAANKVPLLLGYNNNDTLIFSVMRRLYTGKDFVLSAELINQTIPWDLQIPNEEEREKVIKSIKATFFPNEPCDYKNIQKVTRYTRGPWFIAGYLQAIKKHIQANHEIYAYVFTSDTKLNFFKRLHPVTAKYKGASHMDELGHLFTTPYTPCFVKDSPEDHAWRTTVKLWSDFAKHGHPTPGHQSIKLKKVTDFDNIDYVNINGAKLEALHQPDEQVFQFWINLYSQYNNLD